MALTAAAMTLTALRRGDEGRVTHLDPLLPGAVVRRLADLGFVPDAQVSCLRRAPLGSPTVYRIGETELCLRRGLSDRVLIEPVA
jgi:ferrous iron transport protein A